MSDDLPPIYLGMMRRQIADARQRFADAAALLLHDQPRDADAWHYAEQLERAIGEISPADALDALKARLRGEAAS